MMLLTFTVYSIPLICGYILIYKILYRIFIKEEASFKIRTLYKKLVNIYISFLPASLSFSISYYYFHLSNFVVCLICSFILISHIDNTIYYLREENKRKNSLKNKKIILVAMTSVRETNIDNISDFIYSDKWLFSQSEFEKYLKTQKLKLEDVVWQGIMSDNLGRIILTNNFSDATIYNIGYIYQKKDANSFEIRKNLAKDLENRLNTRTISKGDRK